MNNNIVFDTLQFAKRAEKAGFTQQQAEFQAEEIAQIISTELVTKRDLSDTRDDIKKEIRSLKQEMDSMANKLTIKFGAMLVVAIGILSVIIKIGH